MNALYRFGKAVIPALFKVLFPYRILHYSPIPEGQAAIVCSNHINLKDPILLALTQDRQINFMAKAELFRNKLLARLISSLGAFPVHRGTGDTRAVHSVMELLKNNRLLGIFIEGTRSKDGNLQRPKSGVAVFAHQTQSPIYPIAIATKNGKIRLFQRVVINCGEPILPEELNIREESREEYRDASRYIMSKISALRDEALEQLKGTKR